MKKNPLRLGYRQYRFIQESIMGYLSTSLIIACVIIVGNNHGSHGLDCFEDQGFTLRRSLTSSLQLTQNNTLLLRECANECMVDPCCMAYGLQDGQCVTSPTRSEGLDFVKEV